MEAAFALLRIQLEIARQDYNAKRIQEYQMLRENVYEQVRSQIKPFKIQYFKLPTTMSILFEYVCSIFSFLKEMVITRTLDQSILDKQQMNKG